MDSACNRVNDLIAAGRPRPGRLRQPRLRQHRRPAAGYRRDLAACDLVLPDGIGMKIAAQWLGTPIRQNVNGTDFFPRLCNAMNDTGPAPVPRGRPPRGGGPRGRGGARALARHRAWSARSTATLAAPKKPASRRTSRKAAPMWCWWPWVCPCRKASSPATCDRMGPCVAIGVGGLFDFVAGRISRAPQWMRDAGLEWTWRLIQEPGRMWQRYLVGNFTFLARVALQRQGWRARQAPAPPPRQTPRATGASAILLATHAISPDAGAAPQLAASLPFGPASFAEMAVAQLASQSVYRHPCADRAPKAPPPRRCNTSWATAAAGVCASTGTSRAAGRRALPAPARHRRNPARRPSRLLLIQAHTWLQRRRHGAHRPRAPDRRSRRRPGPVHWQGWACVSPDDLRAISRERRSAEAVEDAAGDAPAHALHRHGRRKRQRPHPRQPGSRLKPRCPPRPWWPCKPMSGPPTPGATPAPTPTSRPTPTSKARSGSAPAAPSAPMPTWAPTPP